MLRKQSVFVSVVLIIALLVSGMGFAAEEGGQAQIQNASEEQKPRLEVGEANLVPLQVTGPPEERLNLIILGDGYTADEMDKFHADVDRNQNVQWSVEPFRSYRNYFNVYMLEIASGVSGIRCDPDNPKGGDPNRVTPLRLHYADGCYNELARGITYGPAPEQGQCPGILGDPRCSGNEQRTMYLKQYVEPVLGIPYNAQNIQTLAIANTFTYGGIGGVHATTSGGSPQGPLISLHELGHSLGNLQDEYPYYDRDVPGGVHPNREPSSIHHTRMSSEEMIENKAKWWRWLGEESESGGIIRAADPDGYESGAYYSSNVWRPSKHSMMRWLGFYFDQVSREHMTQRITGLRNANEMPVSSTPEGEVGPNDVVWVETMHPRFHELDVTWEINGEVVPNTHNSRHLELAKLDVKVGDTIKVTVQDRTEFVRDPFYLEGPRMTQTREWTVGKPLPKSDVAVEITNHSPTQYPLAYNEVAFVETTHPTDRVLNVTWKLNGKEVPNPHNSRNLDLSKLDLPEGPSQLSATVTDPANPDGESDTVSWIVDNGLPTAPRTLSEPLTTLSGDTEHNVYFNEFDVLLEPEDDQPGYVVGELRLNGDGWYNYFGFPDEPFGTPFKFSHSGSVVKALVYGNLGTGGMSKAAFEQTYKEGDPGGPFIPGFGTHTVEHRAIDAAGNIGNADEFRATVLPGELPECTDTITGNHNGRLNVTEGVTCLENAQINGGVTVSDGASLVAFDSSINGGLRSDGAHTVQVFGTTVTGKSEIAGTSYNVTLAGNTFNGGLTLSDNNQVSANEQFGEYGPILAGNTVSGQLVCEANSSKVNDFGAPNVIKGTSTGQCEKLYVRVKSIESLVKDLEEEEEIRDDSAARALKVHLLSVDRFEQQGADDKVVKHVEGFKRLLDYQKDNKLISVIAYSVLKDYANALLNRLQ